MTRKKDPFTKYKWKDGDYVTAGHSLEKMMAMGHNTRKYVTQRQIAGLPEEVFWSLFALMIWHLTCVFLGV